MLLFGTQKINDKGHLEIGGCDAVELAGRFGTPLYVMDEALIRERCREYVAALKAGYPENGSQPIYAGKAFLVAGICPVIEQEGFWLDVSSAGEIFTARKGGFPARKMVFHGNSKSAQ
jgi:diaminopimelate decarboxylase